MKRLSIALILVVSACTTDKAANTDTVVNASPYEARPGFADSVAAEAHKGLPADDAAPPPPSAPEPTGGPWDVTSRGIGRLTRGTRINEAHLLLPTTVQIPKDMAGCVYIKPDKAPDGVALMFIDGIFARVDVTSGTVKTVEGAHIGSTEGELSSIYKGRIVIQPAKYGNGHTVIVTPPDNATTRIVFETDGNKVTRFRSGREPEVEWVEGCG